MKIQQTLSFQHEVEGRMYCLTFPVPAPLGECYDVAVACCNQFLSKLKEQVDKQEADKKKADEALEEKDEQ